MNRPDPTIEAAYSVPHSFVFVVIIVVLLALLLIAGPSPLFAQQTLEVKSPNGKLVLNLTAGDDLRWSLTHDGTPVVLPSPIALTLESGEVLGANPVITGSKPTSVDDVIIPPIYKKSKILDRYNELTVTFKGGYGIILRAYDDGAAYRLLLERDGDVVVRDETVSFTFAGDYTAHVPFIRDKRSDDPYHSGFEAHYDVLKLSDINPDTLSYAPLLVELEAGKKAVLFDADVEAYPGMFLVADTNTPHALRGRFAPYPVGEERRGNTIVPVRSDVIARISGNRTLPWRAVAVSSRDHELLDSDLVYKLASPSRVDDPSWIKPGKVAWEWWNSSNLRGVDFPTGSNTDTYRFFIDFASANGLEYVILDGGWSARGDLMRTRDEIDLPYLIAYGKDRNVDLILWASWSQLRGNEDAVFSHYAGMGIKGFKVDFIDRDDQVAVESVYRIAERAAAHKLVLDYHGIYEPTGLQRTYPNVINFEGVKGLENTKWVQVDDVPRYDVTAPYIRMLVGPMDYTPGAMRNATQNDFFASRATPMSHGTRVHQLAMYTIFEAPLQMLSDSPTNYMAEQECTDFIAKVPTVFDETVALDGQVGEYVVLARRKGDTWYVGAMTNWNPRELTLDLSFLGDGEFEADIFQDGINAHKDARDYKRVIRRVKSSDRLTIQMKEGGGWTARIYPVR